METGVVVAEGKLVRLRTLAPSDLDLLDRWADDPALEHMVGSELFAEYRDVHERQPSFYEATVGDPRQLVLVIEPRRGALRGAVGIVRLFNIHLLEGYAFLETIVADARALRRGFGVEAGELLAGYAIDVLGIRRIEAKVYAHNVPSANALRRHGFQQEGVLRQAAVQDGQPTDMLVFAMLRQEFEAQRFRRRWYYPVYPLEGHGPP
jgi:RimJ/RimL family protein N-acetyltransferase